MCSERAPFADKGAYQRVGEATELALRVLTEKIGLLGYAPRALDSLSRVERTTYCNDHWQNDFKKVRRALTLHCSDDLFELLNLMHISAVCIRQPR